MLSFLTYKYNDMAWSFLHALSLYTKGDYTPSRFWLNNNGGIDFIDRLINRYVFTFADPVTAFYFLAALYLLITVIFTFLLFRRLLNKEALAVVFSLLFGFSTFFIFRVVSFTTNLYQIFFFPLLVMLLLYQSDSALTKLKTSNPIILGAVLLFFLLFSSYFGFFSLLLIVFWYIVDILQRKQTVFQAAKRFLLLMLPVLAFLAIFYSRVIYHNLPIFGVYSSKPELENQSITFYRSFDDYYNFSFRPWYFVVPPQSSLFFGSLSDKVYKAIESTEYYLANDYSEQEMAGSYMGWHFIIGALVVVGLLLLDKLRSKKFIVFYTVYENKNTIIKSFLIIFMILLVSGPPSFTVSGVTFYTPTYILYYIVPFFRTLSRWSVVIYLFVLIINSYLVQDLYNLVATKIQKFVFLTGFILLNFIVFAVRVPVINLAKPPTEIGFLRDVSTERFSYAVYPEGDYYSIFWVLAHRKFLINPRDFVDPETGFDSNQFTESLITEGGLAGLKEHGVRYLVYYKKDVNTQQEDIKDLFDHEFGIPVFIGDEVFIYKVF